MVDWCVRMRRLHCAKLDEEMSTMLNDREVKAGIAKPDWADESIRVA